MVSEFQFIAVLIAIIFGLSLTHVMSSTARTLMLNAPNSFRDIRLVWTGFVLLILLLNWWTIFAWRNVPSWSFDVFLVLILWAASHYALVITLYPLSGLRSDQDDEPWRPEPMLYAFVLVACLDMAQTAVRQQLFSSVYYLPFTLHYIALAIATIVVRNSRFRTFAAWYFMTSFVSWALIVRRFLE